MFDFNEGASHPHNAAIIDRIVEGAMDSTTSYMFSRQEAEEATKRYFTNLKDEHKREMSGTKARHLRLMRRCSRMDNKLKMRISGLKSPYCPLTLEQREKAEQVWAAICEKVPNLLSRCHTKRRMDPTFRKK